MFITCFQETFNASNREMNSLLRFLRLILKFVSKNPTQDIDYAVPLTVETVRSRAGVAKDNFQKYVGCPKCHTQYLFDEHCPHNCSHVEFPNHPRPSFRKPCGASLFTQVRKPNVEEPIQVPRKIYPMNDVAETLASFLRRPGFENLIDHWKKRSLSKEILGDVYDGRVWKSFAACNGDSFFFHPRFASIGLALNVDWFQPYDTPYSIGAIYMIILNLPRNMRYLRENVIVVGLMPGPKEASLSQINHYFQPMVQSLLPLYTGIKMRTHRNSNRGRKVRAALILVACDIPAARKSVGASGHSSTNGCNKCKKKFHRIDGVTDYSGFADVDNWMEKDDESHRELAKKWSEAGTSAERDALTKEYGVRYSVLLELPYFDVVRFTIIDPMHNLFLGIAKRMFVNIFLGRQILTDSHLDKIQMHVNNFTLPPHIGRIPLKIASKYSQFTANEWKNWTIHLSSCGRFSE